MGGEVLIALNICAFPPELPLSVVEAILRGGADKVAETGGAIAGGHTIDDTEPKYGLCVTGEVAPGELFLTSGARPGDLIVLTKPLGSGIITTAAKAEEANPKHLEAAVASMKTLNREPCGLLHKAGVTTCTDVTGFSLLGHAFEIAERSNVTLSLSFKTLPFLEGAKRYAEETLFPGGACKNLDYYGKFINFNADIPDDMRMLAATPETSGGLLAALPPEHEKKCGDLFRESGVELWTIGSVIERRDSSLVLEP